MFKAIKNWIRNLTGQAEIERLHRRLAQEATTFDLVCEVLAEKDITEVRLQRQIDCMAMELDRCEESKRALQKKLDGFIDDFRGELAPSQLFDLSDIETSDLRIIETVDINDLFDIDEVAASAA